MITTMLLMFGLAVGVGQPDHAKGIVDAAKRGDVPAVRERLEQIRWQEVDDAVKATQELTDAISQGNKATRKALQAELRELSTKHELLRQDDELPIDDIEPYVTVQRIPVQRIPAMRIGHLELVVIDLSALSVEELVEVMPTVPIDHTAIYVVRISDNGFKELMDRWKERYDYAQEPIFWDQSGNRVFPMRGTVLDRLRQDTIQEIEDGGDPAELWGQYEDRFKAAVGRRMRLRRKR